MKNMTVQSYVLPKSTVPLHGFEMMIRGPELRRINRSVLAKHRPGEPFYCPSEIDVGRVNSERVEYRARPLRTED
jgi:hypothetical protein